MLSIRTLSISAGMLIGIQQSAPLNVSITSDGANKKASVIIIDRSHVLRYSTDLSHQLPESLVVSTPANFLLLKKDAVVNVRALVETDRPTVTIDDNRSLHMEATSSSLLIEQLEKRINLRGGRL